MKKLVVILRIAALVSLVLYIASGFMELWEPFGFKTDEVQDVLILAVFILSAVSILLQLYGAFMETRQPGKKEDKTLS